MKNRYEDDKELRLDIEKYLKRKIPDEIWYVNLPENSPPYDGGNYKETIEKLDKYGIKPRPQGQKLSNLNLLRSEISATYVEEEVKKCRLDIFERPAPPFKTLEEIDKWIQKEDESQPLPEGHAPRYGYKLDLRNIPPEKYFDIIRKNHEEKPGIWGFEYATLDYPLVDGWTGVVIVSDGTPLRRLWVTVQSIMKRLDCQEAQATAYILLGKFPLVSVLSGNARPTIRNQAPSEGIITITIKAPVSKKSVGDVYEVLRKKLWGNSRSAREPNERDMEIVRFVIKYQNKEKQEWKSLSTKWNNDYPQYRFDYYADFYKSFCRAWKKVFPDVSPETLFPLI